MISQLVMSYSNYGTYINHRNLIMPNQYTTTEVEIDGIKGKSLYIPSNELTYDILTNAEIRNLLISDVFCSRCNNNIDNRVFTSDCKLCEEIHLRDIKKYIKKADLEEQIRMGIKVYAQE